MTRLVTLSYNSHHKVGFRRSSANLLHNTPTYCILIRKCWPSLGSATQDEERFRPGGRDPSHQKLSKWRFYLYSSPLEFYWKFPGSPTLIEAYLWRAPAKPRPPIPPPTITMSSWCTLPVPLPKHLVPILRGRRGREVPINLCSWIRPNKSISSRADEGETYKWVFLAEGAIL